MSSSAESDGSLQSNSSNSQRNDQDQTGQESEEVISHPDADKEALLDDKPIVVDVVSQPNSDSGDTPSPIVNSPNEEEGQRATTTTTIQATWGRHSSEWDEAMVVGWFQFHKLDGLYNLLFSPHEIVNGATLTKIFEIKQKNYDFYKVQYTSRFRPDQNNLFKDFERFGELLDRFFTTDKYTHRFDVAFSFPGDIRDRVKEIANKLCTKINERQRIFYDNDYRAELARPDLDLYLQNIYRYKTRLIVVFMCHDYRLKEWCGLEARVVRDLIKTHQSDRIILLSADGGTIDGILSIDGYMDIRKDSDDYVANAIYSRLIALGDPLSQSQTLFRPPLHLPESMTSKAVATLQNTFRSISPWYIVIILLSYILGTIIGR